MLEPDEQELFRRLAAFRGSFSLQAAEAVCDADLDVLESLVVKSLLRRWGSGRLGLLDTIREYALERLEASPEAEDVRRRHAEFFLALVRSANIDSSAFDVRKPMRHDVALAEQDNIRGALAWAVRSGSVELGLELATAADWFWIMEDPAEGKRWFARLFEQVGGDAVPPELRAHALLAYGGATDISGDDEAAARLYEEGYTLFDRLGNEYGRALFLHRMGVQAMRRGDLERARELVQQSHAIHERNPEPLQRAWHLAETTGTLGAVARDAGDAETAHALIAESEQLAKQAGMPWWQGGMLAELAALSLDAGRVQEAETRARESLTIAERLHDRPGRVFGVGLLARIAAERGLAERAGRLWGAVEDELVGAPLGGWRRHRDACAACILRLATPEFESGRAEGREWSLDNAVEYALSHP